MLEKLRNAQQATIFFCVVLLVFFSALFFVFRETVGTLVWSYARVAPLASFLGSNDGRVHFELGEYFFTSGPQYDVHRARHHYKEAVRLDPSIPGAYYQLGRSYFIIGRFSEAYAAIQSEEILRPEFGKVHYMKGLIAGYMKNFTLAEIEFKKFIDYDNFNWAGYNDLSWIQFAQGKYHDAEATAREGLAQAAGNPWLQNSIGVNLLAQDRPEEALEYFQLAQDGFSKMDASQWGVAYPGNAPQEHANGLRETLAAIERNIARTQERGKAPIHKQ
jgi:tetratricopeptide (TPR) repeat protein